MAQLGKIIFITGIILLITGFLIWQFSGKFSWFGNLPGDLKIEKENFRFYAPLTSMVIISLILTALIYLIRKIFSV